jgi:hypothetical protein
MTLLATLGLAVFAAAIGPRETEAQRLHRRGVQCMDVIERRDCAIENFEALLEVSTTERELVTDAMLRLIRLHRKGDDPEAVKPLLRRFWEMGMRRESRGHVPYSTRFVPPDFDIVLNVDVARLVAAPLTQRLGNDARDTLFTCDEIRRTALEQKRRVARAKKRAERSGRSVDEELADALERERKYEAEREAAKKRGDKSAKGQPSPIMFESTCPVAIALGDADLAQWQRMTTAFSHEDFSRSIVLAQITGLDAKIGEAVKAGRVVELGKDHWGVPDLQYEGSDVELARLDLDELLIAPAGVIDEMIAARRSRKRSIDRALDHLVNRVPRDTGFFVVLTQKALLDLGLGGMKPGARKLLQALLPKPKGIQIAGVVGDDFGVFTRVPTDNAVKGRALVSVARALIARQSDKDSQSEEMLRTLDVAEASDRRAVLASYILSASQIETMVLD